MGIRLRNLRRNCGLKQREMAERLGLCRKEVERLEAGKLKGPPLGLVARYLRNCGARWSEFTDLLERVEVSGLDQGQADGLNRKDKTGAELVRKTEREAWRYARGKTYPVPGARGLASADRKPRPISPEKLEQAVLKMQEYRLTISRIEAAVTRILDSAGIGSLDRAKYLMYARKVLSAARKDIRTKERHKRHPSNDAPDYVHEQLLDRKLASRVRRLVIKTARSESQVGPQGLDQAGSSTQ